MSGGGGAGLMSCVREGSLEPPYRPPHADNHNHGEGRTGRFLRGLRRMFKRRGSTNRVDASPDPKSSSTSELLDAERHARRKEGAYSSGLSVSHDSVFTGERSGDESSDERPTPGLAHLVSHRAELVAAVRRRGRGDGSDDDEDLGLPRSPPASPPTDKADKRHHAGISHSSCSDGSLLSVGSSEMDEDSSSGHQHDHSARSDASDFYSSSEPPTGVAPLSHSAAKHKMAVRPRRTHGAPRRKKNNAIAASALPITPELNEEMIRSTTPDVTQKSTEVVTESLSSTTTTKYQSIVKEKQQQVNRELQRVLDTPSDTKLKSSSLPPGLALSQLVGESPAKLSIAESNTPRSSIKRSKSSSQGQCLKDNNLPKTQAGTSESQINTYRSVERMSKCKLEQKYYAEESCHEKKSKSEKKLENEVIKSSKKEESFFSRLLLRKSGKKSKKDQTDGDGQQEIKKSKTEKTSVNSKTIEVDETEPTCEDNRQVYKPVPAERTFKTVGQKVFSNQMHKRLDNKGVYVQEGLYKDVYSAAKVSGVEYNITDLKIAEETDKMLNNEMKSRFSRRDEFSEKNDKNKKKVFPKENELDKKESFKLHHDKNKRPVSVQRLVDPFSSRAFTNNMFMAQEKSITSSLMISNEEPPIIPVRMNNVHKDYVFHSGSMPKDIPYFNNSMVGSAYAPHYKNGLHQSSDNVKNRSSERVCNYHENGNYHLGNQREKLHVSRPDDYDFMGTGLKSLGDEYIESKNIIGKSHSFRYASETTSISSIENQMPSLPAIVGISEPLLQNWEVNYRKNLSERSDHMNRFSARNFNLQINNAESNYDSLQSTDSSYLDSLKNDVNDDPKLFTNSIHITIDTHNHKRDSDISQIEAKIDDIISSPKPVITTILKSSSLDSVKSSPEKLMDDRRKTISVESALSHGDKVNCINSKRSKQETETFISVTHVNREQTPVIKYNDSPKLDKRDDKQHISDGKPGIPEFLKIQLNKVDTKPITNVVLTANIIPKKTDSAQAEKEQEEECLEPDTKPVLNIQLKREPAPIKIDSINENSPNDTRDSPQITKKSIQPGTPQTPSTPKLFFKSKSTNVESYDTDKTRTNSVSTEGSTEKIYDNISIDRKSHSSFGSKSSIQSTDSNDIKPPDRQEEAIVYRKKPNLKERGEKHKDDEPELMKVFARRSLKLKDSDAEVLAQEIADAQNAKEEIENNATRTKILKNEFNASIKSRDSDKENDDNPKDKNDDNRIVDIAARVSQFGIPHYQRSVSNNAVNPKRESASCRNEVNRYKKEVSDSTPEKRLRNRTFPDTSNDREDMKNISKSDVIAYKTDSLTKRPWQKKEDEKLRSLSIEMQKNTVIEKDGNDVKREEVKEKEENGGEADASPQFKGILQMRAEWERRAKQGMAK